MKKLDWEPDNWHGFDFSDAAVTSEDDKRRLIEVTIGFPIGDLNGAVYVIEQGQLVADGRATFNASADTLIFRHRSRDGYETVYDCKVRRMFHPRREGCAP